MEFTGLSANGWRRVLGFQTRPPIRCAHQHIRKCALEITDGLLLHPLLDATKPGDVPADVRERCDDVLLEKHHPADRAILAVHPAVRESPPRLRERGVEERGEGQRDHAADRPRRERGGADPLRTGRELEAGGCGDGRAAPVEERRAEGREDDDGHHDDDDLHHLREHRDRHDDERHHDDGGARSAAGGGENAYVLGHHDDDPGDLDDGDRLHEDDDGRRARGDARLLRDPGGPRGRRRGPPSRRRRS